MHRENQQAQRRCAVCFESITLNLGFWESLGYTSALCYKCKQAMEARCVRTKMGRVRVVSLHRYHPFIRSLIIQYKDFGDTFLARIFMESFRWRAELFYRDYRIVCVPSTLDSLNKRGFDHVRLMASFLELRIVDGVLINNSNRKQKEQSKTERMKIGEHLELKDKTQILGAKILLVDDVMTTGSTVRACVDLLAPHVGKLVVLVVASVAKE